MPKKKKVTAIDKKNGVVAKYRPNASQMKKALKEFQGVRLTPKMRIWFYEYVTNGGNATAAARKAYPKMTEESLWNTGYQNVRKLKGPLDVVADLVGISDVRVMTTLSNGLDAMKVLPQTKFSGREEVTDYPARRSYAELILKARGQLTDRTELNITSRDAGEFEGSDPLAYIEKTLTGT